MGEGRDLPARKDQTVSTRQDHRSWPDMAAHLRWHRARSDTAAHAGRDAESADRAPLSPERLGARHPAAASRLETRENFRARATNARPHVSETICAVSRAVGPL